MQPIHSILHRGSDRQQAKDSQEHGRNDQGSSRSAELQNDAEDLCDEEESRPSDESLRHTEDRCRGLKSVLLMLDLRQMFDLKAEIITYSLVPGGKTRTASAAVCFGPFEY